MLNRTAVRTAAPLRQQVVLLMREDILNGNLVPGQRLIETPLCEAYGVSRTVIREALRQLESEHLVQVVPNFGPVIPILTEDDIKAIYVVRASLEGLAGKLFALNATDKDCKALLALKARLDADYRHGNVERREEYKAEFYRQLLQGGGNAVLTEELRNIHARIALFRRFAFVDESRVEPSIRELEQIIDAAALHRDPKAAWDTCEHHIVLAADLAWISYVEHARKLAQAG